MSVNLLNLVKGAIGNQIAGQIGGLLGADEQKTQAGINAAVPALLGGLMKKASTSGGANELFGMLDDHDGGILDDLGGALGGGNHESMISKGMGIIGSIFGSQQSSMLGSIGKIAGLGNSSVGSLLGILAPIVMGVLGKQRRSSGLDVAGMTNLLMSQKDHVAGALPGGLGKELGLSNLLGSGQAAVSGAANAVGGAVGGAANAARGAASATGDAVGGAARDAGKAGGGLLKFLLPLILLAGLVFGGMKLLKGGGDDPAPEGDGGTAMSGGSDSKGGGGLSIPGFDLSKTTTGLNDTFGGLSESIGGITDEASAKLAVPKIEEATKLFDGMNLGNAPAAAKTGISGVLQPLIGTLQKALETAYAIPGVKGILEPAIGPLMEKVAAITG